MKLVFLFFIVAVMVSLFVGMTEADKPRFLTTVCQDTYEKCKEQMLKKDKK
uniref:U-megalopygitoxin(9)-Mo13 n=1 Tax=Megalopyge opercularis TaxID=1113279 RepID=TXU9D_MEGOP|nr:venom protein U-MPTX.9-13 [Megalopyge opercularis]